MSEILTKIIFRSPRYSHLAGGATCSCSTVFADLYLWQTHCLFLIFLLDCHVAPLLAMTLLAVGARLAGEATCSSATFVNGFSLVANTTLQSDKRELGNEKEPLDCHVAPLLAMTLLAVGASGLCATVFADLYLWQTHYL